MANLLRKLKSLPNDKAQAGDPHETGTNLPQPSPATDDKQTFYRRTWAKKRNRPGRRSSYQGILATFQNSVAGRAPIHSSRSTRQQGDLGAVGSRSPRAHTLFAFERDLEAYNREHGCDSLTRPPTAASTIDSVPPPILRRPSTNSLDAAYTADFEQYWVPCSCVPVGPRLDIPYNNLVHSSVLRQQPLQDYIASDGPAAWIRMSSEQAAPPISYERLRQVTTEACDKTLSSVKAYSHGNTEAWNTQIINAILARLVQESTPASTNGSTAQPTFKFVVNATIIQHAHAAPGTADDVVKGSGRRGMHSASGAYWNNQKDGMWSFKYEAAEAKGLDVVVGIIWIWVG